MSDLFNGLESMGFKGLGEIKIYDDEKKEQAKEGSLKPKEPVFNEADFLFEKKMQCPVCDQEFKTKTVKTGKPRLIGSDSDLRPKYSGIDSIKYDAIICPNCGYGALSRFFSYMTTAQAKLIKANISTNFTGLPKSGDVYTYDEAINRHKLVLFNTIVKQGKNSERAYTCLKLAWLFRGLKENVPEGTEKPEEFRKNCEKNEIEMLSNAFEGFAVARSKEEFPVCGMDEATFDYLLADLAFRLGKLDISSKMASAVIVSRTANTKLKEKARSLRELIKAKTKE